MTLATQLTLLVIMGVEYFGIRVPVLRQTISFIYLAFIPGMLIMWVLKLWQLSVVEFIVYSVGLSLSFIMLTGALMNSFYPLIGIMQPISEIPLVATISIIVFLLSFLCYSHNRDCSIAFHINLKLNPSTLSLMLLPISSILGTYLFNFHNNNILLLSIIVFISVIPILIAFNRISEEQYPLVIWVVSISLLFYCSLLTMYIRGSDIGLAHILSNMVITRGCWDPTIPNNNNAMLSLVMMPSIFSILCKVDYIWFVKALYPLLLSFLPVGLYQLYHQQTSKKIAFFSTFLFVSMYIFFDWLSLVMKQGLASIFIMLSMLTIINHKINGMKKSLLIVVFIFSLIVSHYGSSYIFMFFLVSALCLAIVDKKLGFLRRHYTEVSPSTISFTLFSLFLVLSLGWGMYVSGSTSFNSLVRVGVNIVNSITELFDPQYSFTAQILLQDWPISVQILKYLYVTTILFIMIGILSLFFRRHKFHYDYITISVASFIVFLAVLIPRTTTAITTDRVYEIVMIILSPFCTMGGIEITEWLGRNYGRLVRSSRTQASMSSLRVFSIFLTVFLLANSGWISEVIIKDSFFPSIYISKERIISSRDIPGKIYVYDRYPLDTDVFCAQWLLTYMESTATIYTDKSRDMTKNPFPYIAFIRTGTDFPYISSIRARPTYPQISNILSEVRSDQKGYIYLRSLNIREAIIVTSTYPTTLWIDIDNISHVLEVRDKIYSNEGSEIYYR